MEGRSGYRGTQGVDASQRSGLGSQAGWRGRPSARCLPAALTADDRLPPLAVSHQPHPADASAANRPAHYSVTSCIQNKVTMVGPGLACLPATPGPACLVENRGHPPCTCGRSPCLRTDPPACPLPLPASTHRARRLRHVSCCRVVWYLPSSGGRASRAPWCQSAGLSAGASLPCRLPDAAPRWCH